MNVQKSPTEKVSFFDNPKNIKIMMIVFYVLCAILVALDFIVHRHIYLDFEKIPTFYALYGFVACVVLVVLAKLMRKIVMRDENYYHDRESDKESDIGNHGRINEEASVESKSEGLHS